MRAVLGSSDEKNDAFSFATLPTPARAREEPGVPACGGAFIGGDGVEAGRIGGRRDRAAQVFQRTARDPEQEEVEDGEEAELERDGDRVVIHVSTLMTGPDHRPFNARCRP